MLDKQIDIVTAGHICLDLFPCFPDNCEKKIEDVFVPGRLTEAGRMSISLGGSVANTGVNLTKLGVKTALLGKVGDDMFGQKVCSLLQSHGIPDSQIRISADEDTSYSIMLEVPGHDKIAIHHQGANCRFSDSDICKKDFHEAKIFHFGYPSLMDNLCREKGRVLCEIFKMARTAGCLTTLDMAPIDPNSFSGQIDWRSYLENLLPYVDIFLPSFEELFFMLYKEEFMNLISSNPGFDFLELARTHWLSEMATTILSYGAKGAVIKCGKYGAFIKISNKLNNILPNWGEQEFFQPSYTIPCVKTATGSGDAFVAGFLSSMVRFKSAAQAMKNGCACGALNAMSGKNYAGMVSFEKLEHNLDTKWKFLKLF